MPTIQSVTTHLKFNETTYCFICTIGRHRSILLRIWLSHGHDRPDPCLRFGPGHTRKRRSLSRRHCGALHLIRLVVFRLDPASIDLLCRRKRLYPRKTEPISSHIESHFCLQPSLVYYPFRARSFLRPLLEQHCCFVAQSHHF